MKRPGTRGSKLRGTTLVELLVAVTIFAILLTITVEMARPLNEIGFQLWRRARNVGELRMAVEYLRRDAGAAESVTAAGEHALVVEREAGRLPLLHEGAAAPDPGVLYHLDEGRLLRNDLLLEEEIVVARNVTTFDVSAEGARVAIALAAGDGETRRDLTLVWQP